MKQIQKILILLFTFGTFAAANAQTAAPKFGHLNSNELLDLMPETQAARQQLQAFQTSLETELRTMETEFQTKAADFQQKVKANAYSELTKSTKQRELQDLQQRILDFQQNAQQELANKEVELLEPVLEKAQKAIDAVAAENGFTYILDTSKGAVLFAQDSLNILPLVKTKLGII